jgi:hypothetical protein
MQIFLIADTLKQGPPRDRANERGAALISVLLFSVLLLAAGGALIMTTALSATNAVDATAETQAYYAAEAGMQATLAVLRGNVAPNPLFDIYSPTAAANKISFRKAVTLSSSNASGDAATTSNTARLSRWLNYNALTDVSRVEISSPYSSSTGMAYTTMVDDPDNTANQIYSTLGSFGSDTPSSSTVSFEFKSGGEKVTVFYDPQPSLAISASGTTLGTFRLNAINGTPPISGTKSTFVITIRQVSSSGTIDVPVKCTLAYESSSNVVSVTFQAPSPTSNNISGTTYVHAASVTVSSNGTTSIPVTITPPEPPRVRVTVTGYGPRGAKKQMHMLVSRYAFDYTPSAAITLRSVDSGVSPASIAIGNSSQYSYTGNDHAGGTNLPAFVVTNAVDYVTANALVPGGSTQVTGNPALQQSLPSSLSSFLQTADSARALVDTLRIESQNARPSRYFTTATPPSDFGASAPNGLLTFVDGDVDLPPGGGAGLLVVTGTLTMRGSSDFKGVILVLGAGQLLRDGGGNGNTLGSIVVASFGSSGGFLAPTFNSNGSGTSDVSFDSDWTRRALLDAGPRVLGVSEY